MHLPPDPSGTSGRRMWPSLVRAWSGTIARLTVQFVAMLVLARLLGPGPFGVFAIAMLPVGLCLLVGDAGLATALVQRAAIDRGLVTACLWWSGAIGCGLALLVAMLAAPYAMLLGEPAATVPLIVLAATVPAGTLGLTTMALLKRDLRFGALHAAQTVAVIAGYLLAGIPLALAGAGVWALVIAQVVQVLTLLAATWALSRPPAPRPRPWPDMPAARTWPVACLNVVNWSLGAAETALIGRLAGTEALGIYNRLMSISGNLAAQLVQPAQAVLFSTSARDQDDPPLLRRRWRRSLALTAGIGGLAWTVLATFPDTIVGLTLGPAWAGYAGLLVPLGATAVLTALMAMSGPLLNAVGRPGRELAAQAAAACVVLPLLVFGALHGLTTFAWSATAAAAVRCLLVTAAAWAVLSRPMADAVD